MLTLITIEANNDNVVNNKTLLINKLAIYFICPNFIIIGIFKLLIVIAIKAYKNWIISDNSPKSIFV